MLLLHPLNYICYKIKGSSTQYNFERLVSFTFLYARKVTSVLLWLDDSKVYLQQYWANNRIWVSSIFIYIVIYRIFLFLMLNNKTAHGTFYGTDIINYDKNTIDKYSKVKLIYVYYVLSYFEKRLYSCFFLLYVTFCLITMHNVGAVFYICL